MRARCKLAAAVGVILAGAAGMACAQTAPSGDPSYSGGQETYPDQAASAFEQPDATAAPQLPRLDWAAGLVYEHTDNVNRTSLDPVDQDILQPTLNFTYRQQGSKLRAEVAGILQYTDYLQSYYGNDIFGQLSGQMNWTISPQRLNFDLEDYASVQPVNTRLSNAPSNLQQVNILVAGPTLTFRMGEALGGEADFRYINTTASKSKNYNSQRGMGAFRIIRALTPTDTLSGNIEATHVDFNNADPLTGASTYEKYNAYLQYQRVSTYVNLNLEVGGSRIDFNDGGSSHAGTYVSTSLAWHPSSRNVLTVGASNQIADATADLIQPPDLSLANLTNPNLEIGHSVISPTVYRERGLNLSYAYLGQRLGFNLGSYYARLRPLNNGGDVARDGYAVSAGATYLIQPLLTLGVNASYQVTKYVSDHSRDRDPAFSIYLSRQITPHWRWNVTLARNSRLTTVPGLGYHENQIFASLYYLR